MTDYETAEEQKLHELLVTQASRATVPTDLLQKISHREAVNSPNRLRRVLMVAATLAVAIGFASWAIAANTSQPTTEAASGMQDFLESVFSSPDEDERCNDGLRGPDEMIVWMLNDATDEHIAGVDDYLGGNKSVLAHRFVNQAETYAEFEAFWNDSPEVLDTVTPEDLPTSFRITAVAEVSPSSLAPELTELEGVLKTDFMEKSCQPSS